MAKFARPDSDVDTGGFTTTPLYTKIDEATRSDTDYVESDVIRYNELGGNPIIRDDEFTVGLSDVTDPSSSSNHIIRYAYRKNTSGGTKITLTTTLLQGTTVIGERSHSDISSSWQGASFVLSASEADAITDYSDLRLKFKGEPLLNDIQPERRLRISWGEVEVPDPDPGGTGPFTIEVGIANGADSPLSVGGGRAVTVGLPSVMNTAITLETGVVGEVGIASESNSALGVSFSIEPNCFLDGRGFLTDQDVVSEADLCE